MAKERGVSVRFKVTETTRQSLQRWIDEPETAGAEGLWPSSVRASPDLSIRQYAQIMRAWVTSIGPEPSAYGI